MQSNKAFRAGEASCLRTINTILKIFVAENTGRCIVKIPIPRTGAFPRTTNPIVAAAIQTLTIRAVTTLVAVV